MLLPFTGFTRTTECSTAETKLSVSKGRKQIEEMCGNKLQQVLQVYDIAQYSSLLDLWLSQLNIGDKSNVAGDDFGEKIQRTSTDVGSGSQSTVNYVVILSKRRCKRGLYSYEKNRGFLLLLVSILDYLTLCALLIIGNVETNPGPNFECLKCESTPKFLTLGESVLHQKCHMNDRKHQFICPWPSCSLKCQSYQALDIHVHYFHKDHRDTPQVDTSHQLCTVSGCLMHFPSYKLLCQHLMKFHITEEGIKVQCPFKEVCRTEHHFPLASFKVHLTQHHKGWNTCLDFPTPQARKQTALVEEDMELCVDEDISDSQMDVTFHDILESNLSNPTESAQVPSDDKLFQMKEEFHRSLAMFYMKLEGEHLLPVSTVQVIAEGLAQLSESSLLIMKETVKEELSALNLPVDVSEKVLTNILSADTMFNSHHKDAPGPSMSTNALRKSYYKTHFKFVEPKEINLSKDPDEPKCIYYVPIKKTLKLLLSDPEIDKEVVKSFSRTSEVGVLSDYKDGSLYKEFKNRNPQKTIDLLIFQDAFTPTKDLSSVSNVYQILGMYMTIGNLPPYMRSKLDCMKLVMLIPDFKKMFTEFKLGCFHRVVKELKKLEETGIFFNGEQVRVQLQFLIGDNKGQHEIGGFIQSFSSDYFCRYCPMSKTEIQREPWRTAPFRTCESYEAFSELVPADRASYMGVSRPEFKCPFNVLKDFHVCDLRLPPCVGHDHFEGAINYDLSLCLQYFVLEKKWFTYEELNRKIKQFKYKGQDSRNKPAPVKYDKKKKKKNSNEQKKKKSEPSLGGHAVQNWTLLRLLPFILEDDVKDVDDDIWRLVLLLKQITEYVCAPSITLSQLSYLKALLEEYSSLRTELLGNGKPKHHYVLHFPDLMEILGPVIQLMTLRFENYHQFFKRAARNSRNFINIGVTLMKKYCLYIAYQTSGNLLVKGVTILDQGVTVSSWMAVNYSESVESALEACSISDQAYMMKSISVDDMVFKESQWLLLGNEDEYDVAIITAQIKIIVLDGSNVFLVLDEHKATPLPYTGIYQVQKETRRLSCVPLQDIKYPIPQEMYQWRDHQFCFSLKHTLAHDAPSCQ